PLGIGMVQEDNVMAEFNIPPATTAIRFSNSIQAMINELDRIAGQHGCYLEFKSYAQFQMPELMHPQAMTIGCDPDYNAWTERRNPTRNGMELGPVRTAAGHVHIGVPNPNIAPIYRTYLARACDLMLGVPSILLEDDEENI